jgi:hypothetical protein
MALALALALDSPFLVEGSWWELDHDDIIKPRVLRHPATVGVRLLVLNLNCRGCARRNLAGPFWGEAPPKGCRRAISESAYKNFQATGASASPRSEDEDILTIRYGLFTFLASRR